MSAAKENVGEQTYTTSFTQAVTHQKSTVTQTVSMRRKMNPSHVIVSKLGGIKYQCVQVCEKGRI